jgi:GAF domain-containing protein
MMVGMTTWPKPSNEAERLEALRQYHIMDTPPEALFDDIVRVAAQICETPIATVTLVDETRQWFKAQVGLTATESPREHAFCTYTICEEGTMMVNDAQKDARFAGNPLVTGAPHIRFYGGVPLHTARGEALGSLCVIDRQPRHLTPAQTGTLEALGRQVMAHLEARRVAAQLAAALEQVNVLKGLLPICGRCKKIKDDAGAWVGVDTYIAQHAAVDFTHGICPHCLAKYRSSLAALR